MAKNESKDDPVLILIGYIFPIVGLLLYFLKKDVSNFSRYHFLQAGVLFLLSVVFSVTIILSFVSFFIWLFSIYLGIQVYQGKDPRPLEKYISQYV